MLKDIDEKSIHSIPKIFLKGWCYDGLNDYLNAIKEYTKVLSLDSKKSRVYYYKGLSWYNAKNYKYAKLDLIQGINGGNKDPESYYWLSMALEKLGEYKEAVMYLTKGINKCNKNEQLLSRRAYFKSEFLSDNIGAIEDMNILIIKDPNDAGYYASRGRYLLKLKEYKLAMDDYSMAIKNEQNSVFLKYYYSDRAECKQKSNDLNGACLDWSKAGELGDSFAYDKIAKFCK